MLKKFQKNKLQLIETDLESGNERFSVQHLSLNA